ncbi:MAG: hypothetical protein COB98_11260 [Flavobacteriaceae bacterium]|nr:MAG: hypothetical protein COB98_11260 [Flavobacteriaceae bacterium]
MVFFLLMSTLISCKAEPEAINYGKDICNYCKMEIIENSHAAQYVTKRGGQFKFDAIECLVHALSEVNVSEIQLYLVSDFSKPGTMIIAQEATYLVSHGIKSPMGANLSAVSSKELAEKLRKEHGGDLYTWDALIKKLDL